MPIDLFRIRCFLVIFCVLLGSNTQAQKPSKTIKLPAKHAAEPGAAGVYDAPEEKAFFPYGQDSLNSYIKRNMHIEHTDKAVSGKAIVVFIVEADGNIDKAEILSTSGDKDFDKEAVRVVKTVRGWIPAKNKGKVVRSTSMLSVTYQLK